MFFRQESFLFFPTKEKHLNHQLKNVDSFLLERSSATLRGWLVNPLYAKKRMIIYFGGNAEDVFLNAEEFVDIQAATLLVAYRGYGPSSGQPGEAVLYEDALAIIDALTQKYNPAQLVLIGRSLGSGIACYGAAHRRVAGLILITPYDSIVNVAKSHYPWLPVSLLLKHKFDSLAVSAAISCPVLVLYGEKDTVVPPKRTENLLKSLPEGTRAVLLKRADHGSVSLYPEYWRAILEFLDDTTPYFAAQQ